MAATPASSPALEPERGERRDLDLGGRTGRLLDVLALLVALVDALAAAVAVAAAVALAAALAAAVVALARWSSRSARLSPAARTSPRGRRPAHLVPARRSAPAAALRLDAVCGRGRASLPRRRLPPRLRRRFCSPSAGAASADAARGGRHGRVGGGWCHSSLSSSTTPYAAARPSLGSRRMLARDKRGAREFVLWGATRRAARLSTDWCSFPSEHCPVITMSVWSASGGRLGARRLGGKPAPVV